MLLEDLRKSVKKMKQLDLVKNASLDAEKRAKNDSDYSDIVADFSTTVCKLSQVFDYFDYDITDETLQYLEEGVKKLLSVVSDGVVDSEVLGNARQHVNRKINPNLAKEWKAYYQKKMPGSISKLNTLGNLAPDPESIVTIRANIGRGCEWTGLSLSDDGINTRLDLLKKGIDEVDRLEKSLNLPDEVKDFIVLVTTKKAKVSDITENIIKWIKAEQLEDKFVINFKN